MKRFLVFAGTTYYPSGGWHDLHSTHDSAEEAVSAVNQHVGEDSLGWSHAVDTSTAKVIYRAGNDISEAL